LAALKLTESGFRQYRERVVREYGEDVDDRFYYGTSKETIVEKVTDPETGKTKKTKKELNVIGENNPWSMYARTFDASSPEFSNSREMNEHYLRTCEDYFNNLLRFRGYLFLNEVYKHLHFEETRPGQVVGWTVDGSGDGFVDFGLDNGYNKHAGDNRYIIDFNVNGVILDILPEDGGTEV
jgi:hypothetical protein